MKCADAREFCTASPEVSTAHTPELGRDLALFWVLTNGRFLPYDA